MNYNEVTLIRLIQGGLCEIHPVCATTVQIQDYLKTTYGLYFPVELLFDFLKEHSPSEWECINETEGYFWRFKK